MLHGDVVQIITSSHALFQGSSRRFNRARTADRPPGVQYFAFPTPPDTPSGTREALKEKLSHSDFPAVRLTNQPAPLRIDRWHVGWVVTAQHQSILGRSIRSDGRIALAQDCRAGTAVFPYSMPVPACGGDIPDAALARGFPAPLRNVDAPQPTTRPQRHLSHADRMAIFPPSSTPVEGPAGCPVSQQRDCLASMSFGSPIRGSTKVDGGRS